MKRLLLAMLLAAPMLWADSPAETVKVKIVETSDVHGNFFPEDFITRTPAEGSLSRVHSFVTSERAKGNVVLLDNGDILQGQPTAYYYNFIDTVAPHIASEIAAFMGYDAQTIGNHDVETGHAVYDRWIAQNAHPTLGANVIDAATGEPYLKPYTVIERDGVRIAVLGLLSPAIPGWLPEKLWSGLRFDDMVETARKWVPVIKETERPDMLVGMFHAGRDSSKTTGDVIENASLLIAQHVPGFDLVLMGHDHSPFAQKIVNDAGESVLVINPASSAKLVGDIDVTFSRNKSGGYDIAAIDGRLTPMADYEPSAEFLKRFAPQRDAVDSFVSERIGALAVPLTTRDAYFGPSAFIDFIHSMQLALTGADVSFAAPLSFDATIPAGDICVSDMFSLYKYENMLYTMGLTGREIKDYLEMSYDIWTNTMTSPDDRLLRLRDNDSGSTDMTHTGFVYPSYNFDSAAGIIYTVDVTKPRGSKIEIISMADGTLFDPGRTYRVAVNSYRGNGGGNLMTEGAGIPASELTSRILDSTDKDLRYYMMDYIKRACKADCNNSHSTYSQALETVVPADSPTLYPTQTRALSPAPLNHWRFIPEQIVAPAAARDRRTLFGD